MRTVCFSQSLPLFSLTEKTGLSSSILLLSGFMNTSSDATSEKFICRFIFFNHNFAVNIIPDFKFFYKCGILGLCTLCVQFSW